jgi:hypothetical protein
MAVTSYHRYIADLWDDLDLGELVGEMSDFLLQSGFGTEEGEFDEDQLEALHDAILDALMRKGMLSRSCSTTATPSSTSWTRWWSGWSARATCR